jgi:hypothetical protein
MGGYKKEKSEHCSPSLVPVKTSSKASVWRKRAIGYLLCQVFLFFLPAPGPEDHALFNRVLLIMYERRTRIHEDVGKLCKLKWENLKGAKAGWLSPGDSCAVKTVQLKTKH